VIDREDIDMVGTDHVVGPVRKPMNASTTYASVTDGIDLGFPPESIEAGVDGAQKDISES